MFDLTGEVAIVTGGSRGIGRGCVLALPQQGADVAIGCHGNVTRAEEVAAQVRAMGRRALVFAGNVAQPETAELAVTRNMEELGALDVLVLCAGR